MQNTVQVVRLGVVTHYTIHIVEKDEAVVLYNRTRPLILTGQDKVRIFQYIADRPDQLLSADDLIALPEEDILLIAQMLQDNILAYLDVDVIYENTHEVNHA